MALEVDALVRSIEDEKIEEEQRERVSTLFGAVRVACTDRTLQTRDVLARIDGINDKVRLFLFHRVFCRHAHASLSGRP